MIRYVHHADIDKAEWDRRLRSCSNMLWYAQSYVLDIASPDWEALVDDSTGAMMPLTWRKKFGVRYLFQPFGLQQLGVFAPATITQEVASAFIRSIPDHFRLAQISINQSMPAPAVEGWHATEHTNQVLDLSGGIERVRTNYSKGHERKLRKGLDVEGLLAQPMDGHAFSELFQRTTAQRFAGIDVRGLRSLPVLLQAGIDRGDVDILGVRGAAGVWGGGIAFAHWCGRSILLKSAVDEAGREMNAMFHLVDAGAEHACGRSSILDFAGSEHPGTARFYEGFGARSTVYLRLTMNDLPFWLKPFKR